MTQNWPRRPFTIISGVSWVWSQQKMPLKISHLSVTNVVHYYEAGALGNLKEIWTRKEQWVNYTSVYGKEPWYLLTRHKHTVYAESILYAGAIICTIIPFYHVNHTWVARVYIGFVCLYLFLHPGSGAISGLLLSSPSVVHRALAIVGSHCMSSDIRGGTRHRRQTTAQRCLWLYLWMYQSSHGDKVRCITRNWPIRTQAWRWFQPSTFRTDHFHSLTPLIIASLRLL